ncbi:MAG TPA: DsbA family protein [Nocardioidaceae bacterium]|nr:DsbA family protein [Nocardioidaceae bacterium]
MASRVPVDFWFDPACPWAWITSRWIVEVEQVRAISVAFHVMSLAILNEEKNLSEPVKERQLGPVRVLTAIAQTEGEHLLRDLYTAIGTRIHVGATKASPELVADALAEVGVAPSYLDAWGSEEYDEALAKSHHQAMELVGYDVGTPVIRVEGEAFFGPVVTKAPRGEAAGRLWDGFVLLASTPGFYEIKRSRTANPVFD